MIKNCYECDEYAHFGLRGPLILVTCRAAPEKEGPIQKELNRLNKLKPKQWLREAREDGVIIDDKKSKVG